MTPATTQPLTFESEGNAGNTDENFRETFADERVRRGGRLEDSVRTGGKLGAIMNASSNDHAGRSIYPRIEDGAARLKRVGEDTISRDFVAYRRIENNGGSITVQLAREQMTLDKFPSGRRALARERVAARDHDRAKIFLFVRHSLCHGGSGFNCSIVPRRRRRARPSLSLSFSNRLTAGLYPRYVLSRKPSMRSKNI